MNEQSRRPQRAAHPYGEQKERRLIVAGLCGVLALGAAAGSELFLSSFWSAHAMLTSLLAGLLVLGVTVVVLNEAIELRDRRRWSLLAQSVLFALVQHARSTWTALIEVLHIGELAGGSPDGFRELSPLALDLDAIDAAARELLEDPERRTVAQQVLRTLAEHGGQVVANWAPVMVSAAPYAEVLDRHVELVARLQWLSDLLAQREPAPEQDRRRRTLTRSSVATENADAVSAEEIHALLISIVLLAATLDRDSRTRAFGVVSGEWWQQRTKAIIQQASTRQPSSRA